MSKGTDRKKNRDRICIKITISDAFYTKSVRYSTLPLRYNGGIQKISVNVIGRLYVIFLWHNMRPCAQLNRQRKKEASSVEGELVVVKLYLRLYWSDLGKWRRSKKTLVLLFPSKPSVVLVRWPHMDTSKFLLFTNYCCILGCNGHIFESAENLERSCAVLSVWTIGRIGTSTTQGNIRRYGKL